MICRPVSSGKSARPGSSGAVIGGGAWTGRQRLPPDEGRLPATATEPSRYYPSVTRSLSLVVRTSVSHLSQSGVLLRSPVRAYCAHRLVLFCMMGTPSRVASDTKDLSGYDGSHGAS
eukprot:scaffold64719_cov37-Tisochrysis_lutea.AAC.4